MKMPAGIFANLFVVSLENEVLSLVEDDRSKYPFLKELRGRASSFIYADGNKVYGYGKDLSDLRKIGFKDVQINASNIPKTTCRIISDAFCERLNSLFYKIERYRPVTQAFDTKNPIVLSVSEVVLLRGCEFRTVFLRHPIENRLVFGLIIDQRFRLECEGQPSSYYIVRNFIAGKYGDEIARETIREIRVKTGDLTPLGRRNSEASKVRHENILNIIRKVGEKFELPTGSFVRLAQEPVNIVIGV
ncbi:MAG: hypothetical protein QXX08_08000 [Candidatus Bathyarchaeia archaeon]